jgi:hypothetical protein
LSLGVSGPNTVAIHTHDVAFGDFGKNPSSGHQHRAARHDVEFLGWRVSMIEVHLVRLELPTAVGTRDAPEVSQELDHAGLPNADSVQLDISISSVVLDVVRPLAWSNAHGRF